MKQSYGGPGSAVRRIVSLGLAGIGAVAAVTGAVALLAGAPASATRWAVAAGVPSAASEPSPTYQASESQSSSTQTSSKQTQTQESTTQTSVTATRPRINAKTVTATDPAQPDAVSGPTGAQASATVPSTDSVASLTDPSAATDPAANPPVSVTVNGVPLTRPDALATAAAATRALPATGGGIVP